MEAQDTKVVVRVKEIKVTNDNQSYTAKLELDNDVEEVLGLAISSDQPSLPYWRGSFDRFQISGTEALEEKEGFEAKMVMSGNNVAPDNRYYSFNPPMSAGDRSLSVRYNDKNNSNAAFTPYSVYLYFRVTVAA